MSTKYKIMDGLSRVEYGELTSNEFKIYKEFLKKYNAFENVFFSYELANKSVKDFKDFEQHVNSKENQYNINEIHMSGVYQITNLVLFLRLFVDNTKNYSNSYSHCKKYIKNIENDPSIQLLKALRDYAQHYSLPVGNTYRVYDVLNEIMTTEFRISKADLLKNKENKRNLFFIEHYPDNEIIIGGKIDEWFDRISMLMENIVENFINTISEDIKTILLNKFGSIQDAKDKYFLNLVVEENDAHYRKLYYPMDHEVLKKILLKI